MIGLVFWRDSGEITDANDALLHLLGYTREDVQRGRLDWESLFPPEHRELLQRAAADILATGTCTPFESTAVRVDGTRVPVMCGSTVEAGAKGHHVGWVVDISSQKRAEADLRESVEIIET